MSPEPRYEYEIEDVTGTDLPSTVWRTWLEHTALSNIIRDNIHRFDTDAVEIGCGYGRMIPMLRNIFSGPVIGYEREPHFREIAAALIPNVEFFDLEQFFQSSYSLSFIMTWTCLQHMTEDECLKTLAQIKARASGYVLLCEETDPAMQAHKPGDTSIHQTTGRPVTWWTEQMKGFALLDCRPRVIERTYPRANVGHMMLFKKEI